MILELGCVALLTNNILSQSFLTECKVEAAAAAQMNPPICQSLSGFFGGFKQGFNGEH